MLQAVRLLLYSLFLQCVFFHRMSSRSSDSASSALPLRTTRCCCRMRISRALHCSCSAAESQDTWWSSSHDSSLSNPGHVSSSFSCLNSCTVVPGVLLVQRLRRAPAIPSTPRAALASDRTPAISNHTQLKRCRSIPVDATDAAAAAKNTRFGNVEATSKRVSSTRLGPLERGCSLFLLWFGRPFCVSEGGGKD